MEWLTDLIADLRARGLKRVEPTTAAEVAWTEDVDETARATLFPTVNSWFMGVNDNIPGRKKKFMLYAGGFPKYRAKCAEVAAKGYEGFVRT